MARNSEKTLFAELGFADPDKGRPEHDAACRYLASDKVLTLFLKLQRPYGPPVEMESCYGQTTTRRYNPEDDYVYSAEYERLVSKGKGDYRKTIGFLDLAVVLAYPFKEESRDDRTGRMSSPKYDEIRRSIIFEVKVGKVEVGQILRQMNLYRATIGDYANMKDSELSAFAEPAYVAATCWELSKDERSMLRAADIRYVHLGVGFQHYLSERDRIKPENEDAIEPVIEL